VKHAELRLQERSPLTYAAALVPQLSLAMHQWHIQRLGLRPALTFRFPSKGIGGTSEGVI